VEWVLCDGGQDAAWVREAARIKDRPRVFDVQVGWGLLGPEYPAGLAYLQYKLLGIRSSKEHQAGDWLARPLSSGQVEYAAKDVEYLPALREKIAGKLAERGLPGLIHEVSDETVFPPPPEPLSLEDFRNAWQLDAAGQAALLFLIDWHNGLTPAETKDAPAPRVFLALANLLPETGEELGRVKGVWFEWARRHGDAFTGKLVRASATARAADFRLLEPPPYDSFERIVAEGWIRKAAAETSAEAGVAPELAFPGRLLKAMTKAALEKGKKEAAAEPLVGWREKVLRGPFLSKIPG